MLRSNSNLATLLQCARAGLLSVEDGDGGGQQQRGLAPAPGQPQHPPEARAGRGAQAGGAQTSHQIRGQYSTVQYSIVRYSIVQYSTV